MCAALTDAEDAVADANLARPYRLPKGSCQLVAFAVCGYPSQFAKRVSASPPPLEALGRRGLLTGTAGQVWGRRVNPWSTSTLTRAGLHWCPTPASSRSWPPLARPVALSLHGK